MYLIDFIIGCCAGAVFGIGLCAVQEKMQERGIDRAVQKEIEEPDSL
ncbi:MULTISPECIES: hypothetical protein [unclassified Bacillus cereus group]|nr:MULTISPECIES: hypothetical protein [unclassified Bacillus cereus group]